VPLSGRCTVTERTLGQLLRDAHADIASLTHGLNEAGVGHESGTLELLHRVDAAIVTGHDALVRSNVHTAVVPAHDQPAAGRRTLLDLAHDLAQSLGAVRDALVREHIPADAYAQGVELADAVMHSLHASGLAHRRAAANTRELDTTPLQSVGTPGERPTNLDAALRRYAVAQQVH
jgi:hypothetical protein